VSAKRYRDQIVLDSFIGQAGADTAPETRQSQLTTPQTIATTKRKAAVNSVAWIAV
jgi:hypothetical protein